MAQRLLTLVLSLILVWKATAGHTIAMYWGQDDSPSNGLEGSLRQLADEGTINQVLISFILPCPKSEIFATNGISYIDMNIAGHGDGGSCVVNPAFPGAKSWDCSSYVSNCTTCSDTGCTPLAEDIKYAQSKGIKVLLSLGGGSQSTSKMNFSPELLLDTVANMFFAPNASYTGPRPFGDAVVDGLDLDLEQGHNSLAKGFIVGLLKHWQTRKFSDKYILSAAPQCFDFNNQYGSSSKPLLQVDKQGKLLDPSLIGQFDQLNIQFYNNEGALDADSNSFPHTANEAQLNKLLDARMTDCWDDYTWGIYTGGKHHCYNSKFLTTAKIWADIATQATAWRKSEGGRSTPTRVHFGTPVDVLASDGSTGGFPWAVYVKQPAKALPQITRVLSTLSRMWPDVFDGVMAWDRGNDNYIGTKMGGTKPSAIFAQAMKNITAVAM